MRNDDESKFERSPETDSGKTWLAPFFTNKQTSWSSVVVGWLVGFIVLISYLATAALPNRSYFEWWAFFCSVIFGVVVVRIIFSGLSAFISLLPLIFWHFFWLIIHALRGAICSSCLWVIVGCIFLLVAIHFIFSLFERRFKK
jgi:hypothetical protein